MTNDQTPARHDKRRVRQAPNRADYTKETLYATLDACIVGHVSFVQDGWPQSIPTAIARIGDHLYLRSAFNSSMNYRSAVVFGQGSLVTGDEKATLLNAFTHHLIPGSLEDFRPMLAKELKATALIRIPLDDFSVKIRTGDPIDDKDDLALTHWAGVIPINSEYGKSIPSADLSQEGITPFELPIDVKP